LEHALAISALAAAAVVLVVIVARSDRQAAASLRRSPEVPFVRQGRGSLHALLRFGHLRTVAG
jgi:hypothetical protein